MIFIAIGIILFLIGWLGFAVKAFGESASWGLGVLFVPFAWIVYLVKFKEGRKFFYFVIFSFIILVIGLASFEGLY